MDKLMLKYQEYRSEAELEQSPTNQAAQGWLDRAKTAARGAGLMGPETPSVFGDLGAMPTPEQAQQSKANEDTLKLGKGPLKQQPQDAPQMRAATPQEQKAAKAPPTAQEAYDPSQDTATGQVLEHAKSQGAQAISNTYAGLADFYGTLDGLAGIVSRRAGRGKPEVFEYLKQSSEYWAEHYQGKVSLDGYMTRVVGGVLGSGPALVEFAMGPEWAALKGFAQNGEIGDALYGAARRAAAGVVFKGAHRLDAPGRIATGTAYMTGESAAEQLGSTGTLDAGQTAEAAGVGLGMMLSGGLGPGNKAGLRQRMVRPDQWVAFSDVGKEIERARESGLIDERTSDIAYDFYAKDLERGGTALKDTSLAVVDRVNLLRQGVDDWILREQGMAPEPGKQYAVTGKASTRMAEDGTYRTAIELYQGARADTLVEEWMHREYDRMPSSERNAVTRAYEAYKAGLPEGGQPMSEAEFYAKGATDKFFADEVAAKKAANRPAWLKAVDAAKSRWDGFVQAVRGVPGAKEDGSAPAMQPGGMSEAYQTKDHPAMAGVDMGDAAQVAEAQRLWAEMGVESPYFKKWFGDSKVVDAQGKPLVVYHGTTKAFEAFDPGMIGSGQGMQAGGAGFYFTSDNRLAQPYAGRWNDGNPDARVISAYVSLQNPYVMPKAEWYQGRGKKASAELTAKLKSEGYDGVIIDHGEGMGGKEIVAFDPTQIKSATGNRGTFDASDPRINYQIKDVDALVYDPTPAPKLDQKYAEGGNTNLWRIDGPQDVHRLINDISKHNKEKGIFDASTRGNKSVAEIKAMADALGLTPEQLAERGAGDSANAELMFASRQLQHHQLYKVLEAEARLNKTKADADRDAFAREFDIFSMVTSARDGYAAEWGRTGVALRQTIGGPGESAAVRGFADLAKKYGGERNADAVLNTLRDMRRESPDGRIDINQLAAFSEKIKGATTFDMILEARYIAMLSNPATHIRNTIGNTLAIGMQIPERFAAGLIGKARGLFDEQAKLDRVELGEPAAMLFGAVQGLSAGGRAFLRAARTGESADPLGKIETMRRAITAENMGLDPESAWGKTLDFVAERLRTGSMLMGAEDDFFKGIGYQMELNARAHRTATQEGLRGQEFAERVSELVKNPPWDMQIDALDFSRYTTFTQELGPGMTKLLNAMSQGVEMTTKSGKTFEHPSGKLLKLAVPFMRTPANIVRFGVERSPLAWLAMPTVAQAILDGGAKRDLALARIGMGSTLGFLVASAATSGLVTGNGPSDPKHKESLREVGWQPYSLKVGDKWISYQALEPYSMIIGAAADIALMSDYMEENERNNAVMMVAGAFSNAITSKTFLTGLDDMLNVLSDPERYGDKYAQRFSASWIPSVVKATRRDYDPFVREIWSVTDALKDGIPGLGFRDLYPRRNRYGDPITLGDVWLSHTVDPARKSTIKNAENSETYEIDKVILENHIPIQRPGRMFHHEGVAVELTPEEFDDYQMLPRELGLVESLKNVIATPEFKSASGGPDGIKSHMIREVFGYYREEARWRLVEQSKGIPGGLAERLEFERQDRELKMQQGGMQ